MSKITKCPHCGSVDGFYRKVYMSGWSQYRYSFDSYDPDNYNGARNDELHSGIIYREQKTCYCIKCDKKIKL